MTDRINAFVVVLDRDVRDDDVEATKKAIAQIKGVLSVDSNVTDISDSVARLRARSEVTEQLFDLIKKLNS